jgi:hypothetical protein
LHEGEDPTDPGAIGNEPIELERVQVGGSGYYVF